MQSGAGTLVGVLVPIYHRPSTYAPGLKDAHKDPPFHP